MIFRENGFKTCNNEQVCVIVFDLRDPIRSNHLKSKVLLSVLRNEINFVTRNLSIILLYIHYIFYWYVRSCYCNYFIVFSSILFYVIPLFSLIIHPYSFSGMEGSKCQGRKTSFIFKILSIISDRALALGCHFVHCSALIMWNRLHASLIEK